MHSEVKGTLQDSMIIYSKGLRLPFAQCSNSYYLTPQVGLNLESQPTLLLLYLCGTEQRSLLLPVACNLSNPVKEQLMNH